MYKHNRDILPIIVNGIPMKHTPSHNSNIRQHSLQNATLQNQHQKKKLSYVMSLKIVGL